MEKDVGISGYRRVMGGANVSVDAVACALDLANDPESAPFTFPSSNAPVDWEVTVHCGGGPGPISAPPLFQTNAWAIWPTLGGGFQISLLREPENQRATIVADRRTSRVSYHEAAARVPVVKGVPLVLDPFRAPVDQMLFVQHLAYREGFILHASGFAFGDVGIVFPGVSGAGKSTLTGLLSRAFPEAIGLSDERIIVRMRDGAFEAWGTSWTGTEKVARNAKAPLRALVFIEQHSGHGISAITQKEAVRRLFAVAAIPFYDPERSELVLQTIERLVATVPTFVLRFARDDGVATVVRDFLRTELGAA